MRGRREGQALLLDALVFLAASSLVSVSMIGALSNDSPQVSDEFQEYINRAHSVFLRATIDIPSIQRFAENKSFTVGQGAILLLSVGGEEADMAQAEEEMSRILSGLLAPRFGFRWTAEGFGSSIVIEDGTGIPDGSRGYETFVSSIDAIEAGIVFELRAWRSAD